MQKDRECDNDNKKIMYPPNDDDEIPFPSGHYLQRKK